MNHNLRTWALKERGQMRLQLSKRKTHMFPFGKTVLKLYLWVLLLAELSAICALGIHLVSSTTVRAWGSRPTSFMVISMWWEFFKICTASSWEMLRKLRPLISRIWSPIYKDGDRETLQMRLMKRNDAWHNSAGRTHHRNLFERAVSKFIRRDFNYGW